MKIILSPAKKMREHTDDLAPLGLPVFLEDTKQILAWLRGLSYAEMKKLLACNDQIAGQNFARFQDMEPARALTPALLSYDGIAYQYMAPSVFEEKQFAYVQDHLRILSGFYGVLRPMDGVVPYRLEMQAKAKTGGSKDLYEYWGDKLYREVVDDSHVIVNLASKEYSRCIEKYLTKTDTYITCVFGELEGEKIVQKGVYAKMARGEMVRFMAEYEIKNPEEMKQFDRLGYQFCAKRSSDREYCFLK
ncbi:MAG: peroxide stress protein YaaA [Lachnospiraceae bacterium]|nr:peroxide stress protein YaaA [Lachnospiraceae bacterium]RKJ50751.1 peroxide stress protein YaaA [bacterium 1XD42-54]